MLKMILFFLLLSFCQDTHSDTASSAQLQAEIKQLENALSNYRTPNMYVVIDTHHNTLQIRKNDQVVHQAICATGSGKILLHPQKQNKWEFTTPQGLWHVKRKVTNPIWAKPVWAFVENGDTVPVLPWAFRRLDQTTLGDYALELGDGYEIHGTLYPTLLGKNITHGCIRLNDEDLAHTFKLIHTGNRVYIY